MKSWTRFLWIPFLILVAVITSLLAFAARSNHLMLYQHGTPEVPGGRAFAIMNPFRNRRPEEAAQELISDLRTSRCGQILRDFHSEDMRICEVLREDKNPRLIWRQDGEMIRMLVYDLPRSKSRLWITSSRDEVGFVVSAVSLIR